MSMEMKKEQKVPWRVYVSMPNIFATAKAARIFFIETILHLYLVRALDLLKLKEFIIGVRPNVHNRSLKS